MLLLECLCNLYMRTTLLQILPLQAIVSKINKKNLITNGLSCHYISYSLYFIFIYKNKFNSSLKNSKIPNKEVHCQLTHFIYSHWIEKKNNLIVKSYFGSLMLKKTSCLV